MIIAIKLKEVSVKVATMVKNRTSIMILVVVKTDIPGGLKVDLVVNVPTASQSCIPIKPKAISVTRKKHL